MILPERVFGRSAAKMMSSGRAIAPIFLHDVLLQLGRSSSRLPCAPSLSVTNAATAWPLISCVPADHRRFGDLRVIDERALDFHRADAVAGDVEHVVDAAEQPEVAVVVALGAVAGEVDVGRPLAPVLLHVALRVAVDAAQHRRPRPRQREQPAADAFDRFARSASVISASMPGNGCVAEPGFVRRDAGQRRDHDRAGLGLPPRVDDRAALAADVLVIPHPRFGIDRLADRSEQAQATRDRAAAATRCPSA